MLFFYVHMYICDALCFFYVHLLYTWCSVMFFHV
jgi:hypothetical protein